MIITNAPRREPSFARAYAEAPRRHATKTQQRSGGCLVKTLVMGTGGVGGYYGARLAQAGEEVTFVARGEHLRAIQQHGLRVEGFDGTFTVAAHATDDPSGMAPPNLVLFCVKTYDTDAAAQQLVPVVGAETTLLPLQNGVESYARLSDVFGADHVVPGLTYIESAVQAPGVIAQTGAFRRIEFGEPDGRERARTQAIRDTLERAGIEYRVRGDIDTALWEKFTWICAGAGTTSLARAPVGAILAFAPTRQLFVAIMREVQAVARARRIPLASDIVERTLVMAERFEKGMRSSMQRDLERGRRLEIDALNGAVVRFGDEHGVDTPVNDVIYACLKLADLQHEASGRSL